MAETFGVPLAVLLGAGPLGIECVRRSAASVGSFGVQKVFSDALVPNSFLLLLVRHLLLGT